MGLGSLNPVSCLYFLQFNLCFAMDVLLIKTETLLEPELATARSGLPSPSKSPTATETGPLPAPKSCAAWKLPSPLPKSTETLLEPALVTARSGLPSPLKSPTATDRGL